mmetsp:Transcript_23423/g.39162  ORF Transcript_23423/g.39162 Transcript_23423/m.39162 type:complete len:349 (-) Transcript_23423:426-1472(-)|eukprot:CAMPEP_0198215202 /NCGR_PEP_ID=MMETSP1445-20131203/47827_1 /TAXON_ID=36898 /ORGANISM="Pyramimonas sp., Strain CCMP2087" /LENGTH=348 /DNA_ID=CAMNT_0043890803 /DNA_START=57 /DNA_END=1103 /DNA_ORIENTATION=-
MTYNGGTTQAPVGNVLFTPQRLRQQSTPEGTRSGCNTTPAADGHGYFARSQWSPHYPPSPMGATPTGSAGRYRYADNAIAPGSREGGSAGRLSSARRGSGIGSFGEIAPPPPMRNLDHYSASSPTDPSQSVDLSPSNGNGNGNAVRDPFAPFTSHTSPMALAPAYQQLGGPSTPITFPTPGSSQRPQNPWPQQTQEFADPASAHCWVTVYGFTERDKAAILHEMKNRGVVVVSVVHPKSNGNWLYLEYRSKFDALTALKCNGVELVLGVRVGVQEIDASGYREVQERSKIGGDMRMMTNQSPPTIKTPPKTSPVVVRPYHVYAHKNHVGVPQPSRTTWNKMSEYLFGM